MVPSSPPPQAMTQTSFGPTPALRSRRGTAGITEVTVTVQWEQPELCQHQTLPPQPAQKAALTLRPPVYVSTIQDEDSRFWIRMTSPFLRDSGQPNNIIKKVLSFIEHKIRSKACYPATATITTTTTQSSHSYHRQAPPEPSGGSASGGS